ncbi:MAG: nucleotide exchange factor GrpE [Lachnospiraceae bacterium]|nr:nucleotide exchange factor GrpE [Lachnospiraceae bacterium]
MADEELKQEEATEEVACETPEESAEPIAGEDNAKEDKKKKKDKKDKKVEALETRVAELEDTTKRQLAEFENFRRRTENEKAAMFGMGAKSVIEKILPVVDNFERGLDTAPQDESAKAFVEGMNLIYRQLMTELEKIGVTPIEAVGKEFNPEFHNAVMQAQSDELESGMVAAEFQKGYMYKDSVVRHSMVSVVE